MDIEELREHYFADLMPSAPTKEALEYAKNEQDLEKEINSQYGEQFDIRRLMDEAHDPLTGTLRDLRIDDRDLPTAKNYFDFCHNYLSGNVPWSRQMWSMLKFFGEICPHPKCSDRRWLTNVLNIPKDFPTKDLPERLTFLEHGVCPKCKRNKRQLIKHERMMNYKEAVFVWGQRCITGDSLVVTDNGLEYIGNIAKGKAEGFQEYKYLVHNGKGLEESSHFYVAPNKERVHKIKLSSGAVIKGTKDHPLMTSQGFKRSEDIQVGDWVLEVVGTNTWGTHTPMLRPEIATKPHTLRKNIVTKDFARVLGLYTAEGSRTTVSNTCPEVRKLIRTTLSAYFGKTNITERETYYRVKGWGNREILQDLMPDLLKTSRYRHVPPYIMASGKELVTSYLQGLFEGDGGLEDRDISYCTISPRLALEVRSLLSNIGVVSTVRKKRVYSPASGKPCTAYIINIASLDSLRTFEQEIGFYSTRKRELLRNAIEWYKQRTNHVPFSSELLPPTAQDSLRELVGYIKKDIEILPYPNTLNGLSKGKSRRKGVLGIRAFFNLVDYYWDLKSYEGVYERVKRLTKASPTIGVNKNSLRKIIDFIKTHRLGILSSRTRHYIAYMEEQYLNLNYVWTPVVANTLSKREYTTYDFTLPKTHQFVANGILNHNSGKSTTVTSGSAYHLHRFLKFPVFGTMTNLMQASTPLTMTFVSLTYGKAYAVLWEPFTNFITESPWFNQYFEMLDYHGNKYGKELYAYKKEFIKIFPKKLNLAPSHPDKSILRGETRFGAAIDELGLFPLPKGDEEEDEESQRANADEAHKSLTNSLTTVQSVADMLLQQGHFHVPNGYMFGVSSPFSERDKVMRLLKDSQGEEGKKFIFGSQLATWEINPGIHRDSPMIALAYEKNFEKADRDFGANPPRVDSPYIQSDVIKEGVFEGKRNSHLLTYTFTPKYIGGTIRQVTDVLLPTCLSLDAGEVDNSFAITGTSYDFKTGKTIVHTVLEVIPQQGLRINHDNLYTTVILPLAKALNVRAVVADRWNSLNILHRLENDLPWEIYIRQISPRRDDFDMFSKMLIDKTIVLPRPEIPVDKLLTAEVEDYRTFFLNKPVAHLAHQITTVREVSPVKPPEKGTGYTDDTYRATILGATKIHLPKIKEILEKAEKTSRTVRKRSGAVFVSRSGI